MDVDSKVVENLNNGRVHIYEPGLDELVKRNHEGERLFFTTDLKEALEESLFVFICVGTPAGDNGCADLKYLRRAAGDVGRYMQDYKIVVDKSTVPVGTADMVAEIIQGRLDKRGVSLEFDVVSNPEFLKEGGAVSDFMKPDRVIVGTDNIRTAELLKALYAPFARSRDKLVVMSVRSAEMTKYAANCMLAAKISFINEIANICEKTGADVEDVRMGIGSDPRIGYHFIYPGVGYGGSCFPKDVRALINTAREQGYRPELLEAIDRVNMRQKTVLAEKIMEYFGSVEGKTLALWGLAFKANTDDMREAPSLELIKELTGRGMKIRAYDPEAGENARGILKDNPLVEVVDRQYKVLGGADCLAVVTEWNQFRNPGFERIGKELAEPVIFDGRNLYKPEVLAEMGLCCFSIGRPSEKVDWEAQDGMLLKVAKTKS